MRKVIAFGFGAMLAILVGCASNGWQSESVPLPTTTPFDSDQLARNAYLEGYRIGYRAQQSPDQQGVQMLGGPYLYAQQQGFQVGAAQARSEGKGTEAPVSMQAR